MRREKKEEKRKSREEEVREKAESQNTDSVFPGQEKGKLIQKSLEERHGKEEN